MKGNISRGWKVSSLVGAIQIPEEDSPALAPSKSSKPPVHHNAHSASTTNSGYQKGNYEAALSELNRYIARIEELDDMISALHPQDSEALGKMAIKGRVATYLHNSLHLFEQYRTQMMHTDSTSQSPKTNAELSAYETRKRLLIAQNIPMVRDGELVSKAKFQQSDQNISYLKADYDDAMQAVWPQSLHVNDRAKAPVLFKSDKLHNVYHIINPTLENTNCVNCAEALAKSIQGYKTSAMRDNPSILYDVNIPVMIKAHNIPQEQVVTKLSDVEQLIHKWGDGAIAIIGASRERGTGHNFVVVNDAGTVRFLDRQVDADRLTSNINFTEIAVLRVDKQQQQTVTRQPWGNEQLNQHSASPER